MRCGKEQNIYAPFTEAVPRKWLQRKSSVAADVRIKLIQLHRACALTFTLIKDRLAHPRMAGKQTRQLKAGVAGCPDYSRLNVQRHQARMASKRVCNSRAFLLFPEIMRIVSSPATVPTTSLHPSASIATATGCALPGMVLITSRFCARRTSRTNSRTTRETAGSGSVDASPLGIT